MSQRVFHQEITTHLGTLGQMATALQEEFATRKVNGWKLTKILQATTAGSTVALLVVWELEGVL